MENPHVTTPVEIKADKEYWVGYTATASGGYPFATDRGPMVPDKGGWYTISGSEWNQLAQSNKDYNFLIRAIVSDKTTDVPVNSTEENAISFYPNPVEDNGYIKFVNNQNSVNANIEVVNMLGQVIISQSISNLSAGENVMPVNLSGLPKECMWLK